ncbi:MAG: hypothetical protein ACI4TP_06800 [Anaerotignum sp.]
MGKKYAEPDTYEAKLEKVMARLGVDSFDYDWSRRECWVEFYYKEQPYRFAHSLENAKEHGVNVSYGSDLFAQVVLSLEDLARMVERGIYDLSTWVAGMKALPAPTNIPECFVKLGFTEIPKTEKEVQARYRSMSKILHPDNGGTEEEFIMLQEAQRKALEYLEG